MNVPSPVKFWWVVEGTHTWSNRNDVESSENRRTNLCPPQLRWSPEIQGCSTHTQKGHPNVRPAHVIGSERNFDFPTSQDLVAGRINEPIMLKGASKVET
jgi:hypothetical protein